MTARVAHHSRSMRMNGRLSAAKFTFRSSVYSAAIRNIALVSVACLFNSAGWTQSSDGEVKQKIVGRRVVSSQRTLNNGKKTFDPVLGPHGMGYLIYSADGHMCAELMNPDRPACKNNLTPTDNESRRRSTASSDIADATRSTRRSTPWRTCQNSP